MTARQEMKLLNSQRRIKISRAIGLLSIASIYKQQKVLEQRVRICGLKVGD